MDLLQNAALEYEKLTKGIYEITFSNGAVIRVRFRPQNFRHLAGLGKFSDLFEISSNRNPYSIFDMARYGELTMLDLQRSVHYHADAFERIRDLPQIYRLITQGKAVFGFDPTKYRGVTKLKSTILFFCEGERQFYLALGVAEDGECYYPETFFNNYGGSYVKNQNIVQIVETINII